MTSRWLGLYEPRTTLGPGSSPDDVGAPCANASAVLLCVSIYSGTVAEKGVHPNDVNLRRRCMLLLHDGIRVYGSLVEVVQAIRFACKRAPSSGTLVS